MSTTLDNHQLARLHERISGPVLTPQDAGYDEARGVHNGLIDRRPALPRPQARQTAAARKTARANTEPWS